jgi:hypothetical protein
MVLYRWLQALQVPIRRWEQGFAALPGEASVLLMAQPRIPVAPRDLDALEAWVHGGGTLVLAILSRGPLPERFGLDVEAGAGRGTGEIRPCQPGPYTAGVRSVEARGAQGLTSSRPEAVFHLCGPGGKALAVVPHGAGRVIALSAPAAFSNRDLRRGDHGRLALNLLLRHRGEGLILVDEYHHGHGRARSVADYLGGSRLMPLLGQGALALLIALALWGRRFGPPRPPVEETRHSSMEYVRAMGGLLQRARARAPALKALAQWAEGEARRLQLGEDRALQAAIRGARRQTEQTALEDAHLLRAARGLHRALEAARLRAR